MAATIERWGESPALRLSNELLSDAGVNVGDEVTVVARNGVLVISPVHRDRKSHDLRELVSRIPVDYKPEELDWGPPVGREEW